MVVGRSQGDLIGALVRSGVPTVVDAMPFLDTRRPWIGFNHALRVARAIGSTDVLHFNEHDIYPFSRALSFFRRCPKVCHVRYKLDRGFAQWAFAGKRAPDALLWTSYQQKADSAEAISGVVPEERQHIVRLGINLESFGNDIAAGVNLRRAWGVQDDEILIGIPAPLRPRKRVEDFVELIRRLAPKHPGIIGLIAGGEIAGDEDYRSQIERRVADCGLGRRLRWIGNLEPVEPFHHACDISISTSEYETFGNSVCEAMACGKPVVGYMGGSVAEVVGDAGVVVPTYDLDALTLAVDQLIANPELRQNLGARARHRVATEFSPAASFRQVREIYSQICR